MIKRLIRRDLRKIFPPACPLTGRRAVRVNLPYQGSLFIFKALKYRVFAIYGDYLNLLSLLSRLIKCPAMTTPLYWQGNRASRSNAAIWQKCFASAYGRDNQIALFPNQITAAASLWIIFICLWFCVPKILAFSNQIPPQNAGKILLSGDSSNSNYWNL